MILCFYRDASRQQISVNSKHIDRLSGISPLPCIYCVLTSWSASTALTCSWLSRVWTASLGYSTLRTVCQRSGSSRDMAARMLSSGNLREALDEGVLVGDLAALVLGVLLGSVRGSSVSSLPNRYHYRSTHDSTCSGLASSLQVT